MDIKAARWKAEWLRPFTPGPSEYGNPGECSEGNSHASLQALAVSKPLGGKRRRERGKKPFRSLKAPSSFRLWTENEKKEMSRGDGNVNRFVMIDAVNLQLIEARFPEESFETRGDGFVPRRVAPLVQNHIRHEEHNQVDRLMPLIEQDAENEPENEPIQAAELRLPLEPEQQPENFLLQDYESENSEAPESEPEALETEDNGLDEDGCDGAE